MKPTIEQLAAHNRLLTRQADNMEAEIARLNAQVDMLRGELANTRKLLLKAKKVLQRNMDWAQELSYITYPKRLESDTEDLISELPDSTLEAQP